MALDYKNLGIYELHEHIWNPNVLNMELGHLADLDAGEIRYFITGAELGETKLTVTSGSGEKTISSPAYSIQVSFVYVFVFLFLLLLCLRFLPSRLLRHINYFIITIRELVIIV